MADLHAAIDTIPEQLTTSNTGLSASNLKLLLAKRAKLRAPDAQLHTFVAQAAKSKRTDTSRLTDAVRAAFVFGQEEAGTAVCISASGLLLTCSHCVESTKRRGAVGREVWLASAEGRVVKAKCTAWDERRDLALLQIIAAEPAAGTDGGTVWPFARIAAKAAKPSAKLVCVGHPGSEDLEANTPGQATGYDVLHVSEGRYRGVETGQDIQDNSEIGALKHDCWTYWGHSGAPLIDALTGCLVGLHSSWDDQTGMRRGVALEAIQAFLSQNGQTALLGETVAIKITADEPTTHGEGSRQTPIEID